MWRLQFTTVVYMERTIVFKQQLSHIYCYPNTEKKRPQNSRKEEKRRFRKKMRIQRKSKKIKKSKMQQNSSKNCLGNRFEGTKNKQF